MVKVFTYDDINCSVHEMFGKITGVDVILIDLHDFESCNHSGCQSSL